MGKLRWRAITKGNKITLETKNKENSILWRPKDFESQIEVRKKIKIYFRANWCQISTILKWIQ